MNFKIHLVEQSNEFEQIMARIAKSDWIGFDTEFVGEKSYVPVLCLLQVITDDDIYLIDTQKIKNLDAFLRILEDEEVLKITHAGDNDYRLLNTLFDTVPKNTFDTQIAAGFVGYNYPAGFGKICERELKIYLAKSHTVADWEARPIEPKALEYAIEDVKYLPVLHEKLTQKLRKHKRESWSREENQKWESADFYSNDPYKEAISGDFIHQIDIKEKLFLMRIYIWRREKAADYNVPKENILQNRHISSVVKAMKNSPQGFRNNRTLPEPVWRKHLADWDYLYKQPITATEQQVLNTLPKASIDDPEREWTHEFLYMLVKRQCIEHEISAALLLPKGEFNKLKNDEDTFDGSLLNGWRSELLGKELTTWLQKRKSIIMDWNEDICTLKMKSGK
jgi:ribonuclease D